MGRTDLARRLQLARRALKPAPRLSLIEWADTYRRIADKTSASPGRWRTSAQPIAFGPMAAVTEPDTHTVTIMAGTQLIKSETLLNVACYYVHQDPSPVLFVQPTQGIAASFSKERFAPTVEATPVVRALIEPPRSRDSENTITHKNYPAGSLDFVGANSPSDLASRPKRIILCDEIDKYPPSAGAEGDPLKLAEERASTYKALGRAKFVRTCSPTVEGFSRIGREYAASDQRRCFVACPHCGFAQTLRWENLHWDRDKNGHHLPATAAIHCEDCGAVWSEIDRIAALDNLERMPGFGWRSTREFSCCDVVQIPVAWDDHGHALCSYCGARAPYAGHAGFHVSKLYSKRHRLPEIVREFLESKGDPELVRKFTNTALAELWKPRHNEVFDTNKLMARAEAYGPDDLPPEVRVLSGFCDPQIDRLEVQLVGWGADEECWPFQYTIIHQDPAQPYAWRELDGLLGSKFKIRNSDKILRIAAFGVDMGGAHTAQVLSYCSARRGRRIFACKGFSGARPIWPGRASQAKTKEPFFAVGVDTAKDAIYGRLAIEPPEPGFRKPGYIHFPIGENFGPEYFEQLNSEKKERRLRMGQASTIWIKIRERNEALDTLVGALAVRRSLPRVIESGLQYSVRQKAASVAEQIAEQSGEAQMIEEVGRIADGRNSEGGDVHEAFVAAKQNDQARPNWVRPGGGGGRGWFDRNR